MVRNSHDEENGRRVKRLLQMMFLLQESEARSSAQLAKRFEVSRRTIFRDIQLLRDAGIPIAQGEKGGGYCLPSNSLGFVQLQPLELVAVATAGAPGVSGMRFLRQAREIALAKMALVTTAFSKAQVEFVLERLAEMQHSDKEERDEATLETLVDSWIKMAKRLKEKVPPQP
ncbi:helix-turn-helix transcriptional regulator [Anatilimnocola floriformis]|uniref:helix-turn-helix transcriptional regulator n=1 Tax=Anatilimnocola floriformis TaxID=2948575 RepID=UPI0020C38FE1|nr:HTH domain-containing protein [Anatilimnocola floriformis]